MENGEKCWSQFSNMKSLNVLFCPQLKDIEFIIIEEVRIQKHSYI